MLILNGVDILEIARFQKALTVGGSKFLQSIFLESELTNQNSQHLAGIFCAKEAVMKAFSLKNNAWLQIEILHEPKGRPYVNLKLPIDFEIISTSLSISHEENYAMASFVALVYTR